MKPGTLPSTRPRSRTAYVGFTLCSLPFQASSARRFQGRMRRRLTPHLHRLSATDSVWALPFSLAANNGISIDFFSCWYSDVSFPSVRDPCGSPGRLAAIPVGFTPFGYPQIKGCVLLPGAYRSLPRPSSPPKPSHPPYGVVAYG